MYFLVSSTDFTADFWLFSRIVGSPRTPSIDLRPEFKSLRCNKCRRLETLRAIDVGIPADVSVPTTKRDVIASRERVIVVTQRVVELLASNNAETVTAPFPGAPGWFAVYPKILFRAPEDQRKLNPIEPPIHGEPFQIRGPKCRVCGRFKETTFRAEWFRVPSPVDFAGIYTDHADFAIITWVVSSVLREKLQAASVLGLSAFDEIANHQAGIEKN